MAEKIFILSLMLGSFAGLIVFLIVEWRRSKWRTQAFDDGYYDAMSFTPFDDTVPEAYASDYRAGYSCGKAKRIAHQAAIDRKRGTHVRGWLRASDYCEQREQDNGLNPWG